MSVYLLDVNVWVALAWSEHSHYEAAHAWFRAVPERRWATCPLTQSAYVRLSLNPRIAGQTLTMSAVLRSLSRHLAQPGHEFWPDAAPFLDLLQAYNAQLVGPKQVTDAYLLGLAIAHGGVLATFDRALASLLPPDSPHFAALELLGPPTLTS